MEESETYVGIDVGKHVCVVCVMDEKGTVLENTKYDNTRQDAEKLITVTLSKYNNVSAVCESTAKMWLKTYETFEKHNIPILLANPIRLKLSQSGPKTDKIDATKLANRLRMNDIPTCHVRSPDARRITDRLRQRIVLVRIRTGYLNRQHSICDKYDYEIMHGNGATSSERHQTYLSDLRLSPTDTAIMAQYVRTVRHINKEIHMIDTMLAKTAYESKYARIIMTMPGFDAFSALMLASSIDDIGRFASPKQMVSFLGLCPRIYQSGNSIKYGHMKKDADGSLTWVMMQAAMVACRCDDYLSAYYTVHARNHPPIVARSHVANKMSTCIWHMLKDNKPYRHYNVDSYTAKLRRLKVACRYDAVPT